MLFNAEKGKYDGYIVQELHDPHDGNPDFQAMYSKFAERILWIDEDLVPGAFQMNTAWYHSVPENDPVFPEHSHDEDEIIGFFSSDPMNPYDLGAEIEVAINGERRVLTRSTILFIPGNIPHMPLRILSVERPVFHFSIMRGGSYNGGAYEIK
ncbi:MAG: hypothetical protein HUJ78_03200 [Mogibacterium sp.]|nr:hypothetical protein [Mogibacterium sp.]